MCKSLIYNRYFIHFLYKCKKSFDMSKKNSTFVRNFRKQDSLMKRNRIVLLCLLMFVTFVPIWAQSITLTKEFQTMPNIKALDVYRNQFGAWEKPGADDPFPYVVIRIGLDGNSKDIEDAKERLNISLGRMVKVESVFKEARNELLFLIPSRARYVEMQCNGECLPQMMFDSLVNLQSNTVFYGRVHYAMQDDTRDPNQLKTYPFTLTVEPTDAKVEMRSGFVTDEWKLENGMIQQLLLEGTYYYTIAAEDYKIAEGSFVVDSVHKDTTIALMPKFGWLSVKTDSADLAGLSVEVEYLKQKELVELPLENEKCGLGQYALTIKKPKYHTWKKKVVVHPGEYVEVYPVPQKKVYHHNTFVLAEGGYAMNPAWSVGLMAGQVYGEVTRVCGIGWYVKGLSNFQTTKAIDGALINKGGLVGLTDPLMPAYTGRTRFTEWNVNAGVVLNFLNKKSLNLHKNSMFGVYAGLGYGQYTRYWEIADGRWMEYAPSSISGLSFGGGVIGSIKGLTINVGVNTIMAKYMEIEVGLGWTFNK